MINPEDIKTLEDAYNFVWYLTELYGGYVQQAMLEPLDLDPTFTVAKFGNILRDARVSTPALAAEYIHEFGIKEKAYINPDCDIDQFDFLMRSSNYGIESLYQVGNLGRYTALLYAGLVYSWDKYKNAVIEDWRSCKERYDPSLTVDKLKKYDKDTAYKMPDIPLR